MCAGSTKVKMPKAPELPKPMPVPMAPTNRATSAPKMLNPQGAVPDIRIGSQKSSTGQRRNRNESGLKGSLNIGNGTGLNL